MNPREIKSNAFSHIFQEPHYIAELYEHVSGKAIDPDTIRVTTLQSAIVGALQETQKSGYLPDILSPDFIDKLAMYQKNA